MRENAIIQMIVQRKGQFPTFGSQQDFIRPQRTYSLSYYTSIVAFFVLYI